MKNKITVLKGGRYKLKAGWNAHNGEEVEIIMKRKGASKAYSGKTIYHVAYDPDSSHRFEDYDEEFLAEHFTEMDLEIVSFVVDKCSSESKEKFNKVFKNIKIKFKRLFNFRFVLGPNPDSIMTFYVVDTKNGTALTTDINSPDEYFELDELIIGETSDKKLVFGSSRRLEFIYSTECIVLFDKSFETKQLRKIYLNDISIVHLKSFGYFNPIKFIKN